jgi:hypothetical protein
MGLADDVPFPLPSVATQAAGAPSDASGRPDRAVLSAPVQALVLAVAAVGAVPAADLPGGQAIAEAEELLQQLEVLRAVVLSRVADVDARQLHALADAPSTGTWLAAQQTSLTRTDVARRLTSYGHVAAAVEGRRLSVAVAARVATALAKARRHLDRSDGLIDGQPAEPTLTAVVVDGVLSCVCQARGGLSDTDPLLAELRDRLQAIAAVPAPELTRLEEAFVLLALHVEPADLPGALALLLDALLPNELERRSAHGHDSRGFGLRRKDDGSGWTITRGDLDLECGELLQAFLHAELAVDADNAVDTDAWTHARADGWQPGDELPSGTVPGGDRPADGPAVACAGPRSLHQRRHDALKNGLRRYLDAGIAGLRDKVAPHLAVTVTLDTLHDAPGALPAVAASGAALPTSLVRRWWCDSNVTRFVLSLGRRVMETSHTERTLEAHERRAKRIETGGRCEGAGCSRGPGHRLVPHHAKPWAVTGRTSLSDTVLLCEQTHHDLHSGGHVIRLKDGRRLGPAAGPTARRRHDAGRRGASGGPAPRLPGPRGRRPRRSLRGGVGPAGGPGAARDRRGRPGPPAAWGAAPALRRAAPRVARGPGRTPPGRARPRSRRRRPRSPR